jgi:hypothetical protein
LFFSPSEVWALNPVQLGQRHSRQREREAFIPPSPPKSKTGSLRPCF